MWCTLHNGKWAPRFRVNDSNDPLDLQETHELVKTALEALGSVAGQVQRDVDVTEAFKKFPITRTNDSMVVRRSDFVDTLLSKMKALKNQEPDDVKGTKTSEVKADSENNDEKPDESPKESPDESPEESPEESPDESHIGEETIWYISNVDKKQSSCFC